MDGEGERQRDSPPPHTTRHHTTRHHTTRQHTTPHDNTPHDNTTRQRKELRTALLTRGAAQICSKEFRDASPDIFWNLVWFFRCFDLPLAFLVPAGERWVQGNTVLQE